MAAFIVLRTSGSAISAGFGEKVTLKERYAGSTKHGIFQLGFGAPGE